MGQIFYRAPGTLMPVFMPGPTRAMLKAAREARERYGTHTAEEWRAVVAAAGGLCAYCRRPFNDRPVKDHHIPSALDGSNRIDNIRAVCYSCNAAKSAKMPDEFFAWAEATGFFTQWRTTRLTARGVVFDMQPMVRERKRAILAKLGVDG